MSSTYSTSLRVELIGSGDQAGTWGTTTDNNFAYIFDAAIAGYQAVTISSTAQALTYVNGPTSSASLNQSVYAILKFNGAAAASAVYAPPVSKQYIIWNNSSYAITIYNSTVIGNTTAAGTGIAISAGDKIMVWSDGTNFYDLQAQNLTSTLAIAKGGTGQTTANAAFNALAPAQTSTVTAGNFVVGATYTILTVGTTNFVAIGASSDTVGVVFTATGVGSGTGTATTPSPNRYLKTDGTNTSFDQFNLASTTTVTAGSFVIGTTYTILTVGTTSFTSIGAASNTVGVVFTATGAGSGTGTAFTADYVGLLPASSGGTGVTSSTGSGSVVLSTSPTLTSATENFPTLNYFTLNTYGNIKALFEAATVTASAPTSTTNFDITTQAIQYYTSNNSTNFTLNFRGAATATITAGSFVVGTIYTIASIGTTDFTLIGAASNTVGVIFTATGVGAGSGTATTGSLNSILAIGQAVNCTLIVTNGATAYYPTAFQIDGASVTPKWPRGAAPTAGTANAVDVYTFSIVKTASATYTVLADSGNVVIPVASGGTGQTTAALAGAAFGAIGVGQTWQAPSRAFGTTYTNSTGRPICVVICVTPPGTNGYVNVVVQGVTIAILGVTSGAASSVPATACFVVPDGATYSSSVASGSTPGLQYWKELRT